MPRRRMRRPGLPLAASLIIAVALLGGLAANQAGLFNQSTGQAGDDFPRYDGKTFRVTRSVDGDTFHIGAPDAKSASTPIRLWGVDTPETKKPNFPVQHFGPEASQFTRNLTFGKDVRIQLAPHQDSRDRYTRLLAYVFLPDGRMLNRVLVEQGYAYADPRFKHPYKAEFKAAMDQAKRKKIGLWAGVKPTDLPEYLNRPKD